MNRFRSRKKSFHDGNGSTTRRPSTDSEVPALPTFASRTFKRNKKVLPEPRPQVDLTTALPSSDDFRTSLLMPNLSARFSMLREQDDPNSMLGKANDDSVLFPKRASRLDLFNTGGLDGISEDASLHKPIRPPFMGTRTDSYGSEGYGTDDDRSMISRARPGEGNNMFGGRQKIYKIPIGASGSTKSFGNEEREPSKGMGGKALYGDDVATSAFQKLQEQERQERQEKERQEREREEMGRSSDERSNSPPLTNYNRNRETTSSTTSGPSAARSSTAATSVASQRSMYGGHGVNGLPHAITQGSNHSQGSDKPTLKGRRLYGQGLDQHIHDQQSSAMHRLESLHRQRTNGGQSSTRLQGSRSATNLNDRFQRSGPLYSSNDFRAASPPPAATPPRMGDFDLGLPPEASESHMDPGYGRSPPLSPPMSPIQNDTFVAALEPNDLGKATASGAFNKPNRAYNEQQYLQRQLQLQQGRESPALVRPFSPSAASIDEQVTGRTRNNSSAGPQSRSGSIKLSQQNPIPNHMLDKLPEDQTSSYRNSEDQYNPAMDNSFLSNMSGSEIGSPLDSENEQDLFPPSASYQGPTEPPPSSPDHQPALSDNTSKDQKSGNDRLKRLPEESLSDSQSEITITQHDSAGASKGMSGLMDADSPTLGPATALSSANGLNGLVRAHLRNDSGQSSIYPESSPGLNAKFPHDRYSAGHSRNQSNSSGTFFRESTWDPEGREVPPDAIPQPRTLEMPPPLSIRARQILDQATALRHESPKAQKMLGVENKAQRVLGSDAPRPNLDTAMSWQEQLRAHHARGGSTETEKEREGLANELAERRRAVQDNLRSFVENESRSTSPGPISRANEGSQKRSPFDLLRSKTSKESMANKHEQPAKAMKMLGLGPNTNMAYGSPRPSQDTFSRSSADTPSRPSARDQRQQQQQRMPPDNRQTQPRLRTQDRRHARIEPGSEPFSKGQSPPVSQISQDRSSSENSEKRLSSRNGHSSHEKLPEEPTDRANGLRAGRNRDRKGSEAPRPAEELMASIASHQDQERSQSTIMTSRMRSNSKPAMPSYFERANALPMQPNVPQATVSPSTPGYSVHSAPEGSHESFNESIPVMIPPSTSHRAPNSPSHYRSNRKESINKYDISEPIFKFCTSSVDVVDLPPGASLKNGIEPRPPIPPLNPRRKRTQTLLQALGRLEKAEPVLPPPSTNNNRDDPYEERSNFSADEGEPSFKARQKLRKTSSEGGLNAKARQQAMMLESPAMPNFPQHVQQQQQQQQQQRKLRPPPPHPHQHQHQHHQKGNVPASAVMF